MTPGIPSKVNEDLKKFFNSNYAIDSNSAVVADRLMKGFNKYLISNGKGIWNHRKIGIHLRRLLGNSYEIVTEDVRLTGEPISRNIRMYKGIRNKTKAPTEPLQSVLYSVEMERSDLSKFQMVKNYVQKRSARSSSSDSRMGISYEEILDFIETIEEGIL